MEGRAATYSVEPSIVDQQTLAIWNTENIVRPSTCDELCRIVAWALRNSVWKSPRWIHVAEEDVCDRVAGFLAWNTRPDERSDVRMVDPGFDDGRADRVCYDDCVWVVACDRVDEVVRVDPKCEIFPAEEVRWAGLCFVLMHNLPITFITVDCDIAFARISIDEDNLYQFTSTTSIYL